MRRERSDSESLSESSPEWRVGLPLNPKGPKYLYSKNCGFYIMLGIMVWESIPHYSTWDPLRNMNMGAHQHLSVYGKLLRQSPFGYSYSIDRTLQIDIRNFGLGTWVIEST